MKAQCSKCIIIISAFFLLFFPNRVQSQKTTLETLGDIVLFTLPAATLGTTFVVGDKKGSWQFTKGFLLNQAVTYGLKVAIDKRRPQHNGGQAFPSGHTSTTFQSASFIHRRYGFKNSIPAYALASFTAITRLEKNKHDGWDVLGGVVVGIGSTYLFTTPYQKEHLELSFSGDSNYYSLGFIYKF
jgi:membrane-associated phospholipid phosphatase